MKPLLLGLVLFCTSIIVAQEKAAKVDEFGFVTCEDLLARTDSFELVLNNQPTATGLVIISRGKENTRRADSYRTLILNTLRRRDFDTDRLAIYRGEDTAQTAASFWVVPSGASLPPDARIVWQKDEAFDLSKPVLIGSEDDAGVCPTFVPQDFANLIKKNPGIIGKIVVHQEPNWDAAILGLPWIDTFVKKYGIPRGRLQLIYGKRSKTIGYVEFWLVPSKK